MRLPFLWVFLFLYTDEMIRLVIELWYTKSGRRIKPVTEAGKGSVEEFRVSLKEKKPKYNNFKSKEKV